MHVLILYIAKPKHIEAQHIPLPKTLGVTKTTSWASEFNFLIYYMYADWLYILYMQIKKHLEVGQVKILDMRRPEMTVWYQGAESM